MLSNGNIRPMKKLEKNPRFYNAFMQISKYWNLKSHMLKKLEQVTLCKDKLASLRWTFSVPNFCVIWCMRTRYSPPSLRSNWLVF